MGEKSSSAELRSHVENQFVAWGRGAAPGCPTEPWPIRTTGKVSGILKFVRVQSGCPIRSYLIAVSILVVSIYGMGIDSTYDC